MTRCDCTVRANTILIHSSHMLQYTLAITDVCSTRALRANSRSHCTVRANIKSNSLPADVATSLCDHELCPTYVCICRNALRLFVFLFHRGETIGTRRVFIGLGSLSLCSGACGETFTQFYWVLGAPLPPLFKTIANRGP